MSPSVWFLIAASAFSFLILWPMFYFIIQFMLNVPPSETSKKEEKNYLNRVYNQPNDTPLSAQQTKQINSKLGFMWDNMPKHFKKKYPRAKQFAIASPPAEGTRFRIVPDPVVVKNSTGLVSYLGKYLFSSHRSESLPGWAVSQQQQNPTQDFSPNMLIEIADVCEQPPKCVYPMCDNGGYWSYITPGSGMFINIGKTPLVVKNKVAGMHKVLTAELIHNKVATKETASDLAWEQMSAYLQNVGGGLNLLKAFRSNLSGIQNTTALKAIIFKTMEPRKLGNQWGIWLSGVWSLLMFTFLSVGYGIWASIETAHKQGLSLVYLLIVLIGLFVSILMLFFGAGLLFSEFVIQDFGFLTLDMAKKQLKVDNIGILKLAAAGDNPLAEGLASSNVFDLDLQCIARKQSYSTLILTKQATNSGAWTSRIADLVSLQVLPGPLGTCQTNKNFAQGLCGNYEFKQGPLKTDANQTSSLGPGNVPSGSCECCESSQMKCAACQSSMAFGLCKKVNHPICLRVIPKTIPCYNPNFDNKI
jgi:hypothetical protein